MMYKKTLTKFSGSVKKMGRLNYFSVPKALVDSQVLIRGRKYSISIEEEEVPAHGN